MMFYGSFHDPSHVLVSLILHFIIDAIGNGCLKSNGTKRFSRLEPVNLPPAE